MKHLKQISLLLSACILIAFGACKKDKDKDPDPGGNNNPGTPYTCATCVKTPEANAAYDNSSRGIYKGVLVASTGTIKFNVGNDGNSITAIMVIDGETISLTSSITWEDGEPYVAAFTGMMGTEPVSVTFSVAPDGQSPQIIASSIPGHSNASFTLIKETSNALIEGFEGTYSISDGTKGTFNILLSRALKKWGGVAREQGTFHDEKISGTIDGDKLIDDDSKGTSIGTLSSDEIKGTFEDGEGNTVTVSGKRTL